MAEHPCQGCPTTAAHGAIACPVAATVLNKGRCRRVRAMAPQAATVNLARGWMARWYDAQDNGDQAVACFLRWQSGHLGRLVTVLTGLPAEDQIKSLASPLVVRVRRSANGDDGTEVDPHLDAIVDNVVRLWERGDGATARDGSRDAPAKAERGTSTPRGTARKAARRITGLAVRRATPRSIETASDVKRHGRSESGTKTG